MRAAFQRVLWERQPGRWAIVTLTLPGKDVEVEMDGRVVHKYRRAFLARCRRRWPGCPFAWKLEFQRRGAAHFAALLCLPSESLKQPTDLTVLQAWVSLAWFEIVGSGSESHLRAGTQVQWVRSSRSIGSYLIGEFVKGKRSKEYQHVVPADYHHVGRWWGMSRGLAEPFSYWSTTYEHAVKVRRLLTRMSGSKGYRRYLERARRKPVSTARVYLRGSALEVGWQVQGLRQ
jgi:hypothetical protein